MSDHNTYTSEDHFGQQVIDFVTAGDLDNIKNIAVFTKFSYCPWWNGGYTLLKTAIMYNKAHIARWLLIKRCNIIKPQDDLVQETILHLATLMSNAKIVKLILMRQHPVDALNNYMQTALQTAVSLQPESQNIFNTVKILMTYGANVHVRNSAGSTPLHMAVQLKHTNLIEILMKGGANIDSVNKWNETPLSIAVRSGCPRLINQILSHKPSKKIKPNKMSFIAALRDCDPAEGNAVSMLASYGFSVDHNEAQDLDFVFECAKRGYVCVVSSFLETGGNINVKHRFDGCTYTLLDVAAKANKYFVALFVLNKGFNLSFDKALEFAIVNNYYEMAKLLVNRKPGYSPTPCRLLREIVEFRSVEMAKLFLTIGVNLELRNAERKPLLCHAVERKRLDMAFFILSKGAKMQGFPLLSAAKVRNIDFIKEYVKRNGDINFRDKTGTTALHFATWHEDVSLMRFLLANGARIFLTPPENTSRKKLRLFTTPLHLAAYSSNPEVLETLLYAANIPVSCMDDRNRTPLHIAAEMHNADAAETLLYHEFDMNFLNSNTARPRLLPTQLIESFDIPGRPKKRPEHYFSEGLRFAEEFCTHHGMVPKYTIITKNPKLMGGIFTRYLAIQYLADIRVTPMNLRTISKIDEMPTYYADCMKELNRMRKEIVLNGISYFDVMWNTARIKPHLNTDFLAKLESCNFPIYKYYLIRRYEESLQKLNWLDECRRKVSSFNGISFEPISWDDHESPPLSPEKRLCADSSPTVKRSKLAK